MNSISRYTARISSAVAVAAALLALNAVQAQSAPALAFVLQGQTVAFTHVSNSNGVTAVGVQDPSLKKLLDATGAVMTWKRGERYVLITTSEPRVISFSVGDRVYQVGPLSAQASIAPYLVGDEVYLPLDELLHSLSYALRADGSATVMQPQLSTLDVRAAAGTAQIVARAGAPLRPRVVEDAPQKVVYEFDGVGTTLAPQRTVNAGGISSILVAQSGPARSPKTVVTVLLAPGAQHGPPRNDNERDFVVAFSGSSGVSSSASVALSAPTPPPPPPEMLTPAPAATAAGTATVTGVDTQTSQDGLAVTIHVSGDAAFEWHRLRDPDNRFWVDIKNARLAMPERDDALSDPGVSLRVKQVDAQTVRVAITLAGPKQLSVNPATTGLVVSVGSDEDLDAVRAGEGTIGSVVAVSDAVAPITPAPADTAGGSLWGGDEPVASSYVPTNPKLIVIDPGHGGSDTGAAHGGLTEASLTLDMAGRLRTILQQRGWQVRMTRTTDVDVYAPNDSAHDELQARVNVGNSAGARMFVSIHVNSFINSGPSGTTTYYSKPGDVPLARFVQSSLSSSLGTKDDGIVKSHLYVTLHSYMPAVLVETAFLSNPDDYALLDSPSWRQKVAQAIADGIDRYAQQYPVAGSTPQ
ncbi:MAG: N-acetylmuramoyl-L-alanine amidase [Vulcanimicrobiaceae bacterium]